MYGMSSLVRRYHRGLGAVCPTADVSSLLTKVNYCNIPGVGLTACPGQNLDGIQHYNMLLQQDANNALNQCNCHNAWILNGRVGVDNCASMYPVSGQTQIAQPVAPPSTPSGSCPSGYIMSPTVGNCIVEPNPGANPQNTPLNTQPNAATGTSASSTSTNAQSQQDTSGVQVGGISLSGFQIILGVIGAGLALMALQKGH